MSDPEKPEDSARLTEILELFSRYQRRLFLYIRSLVPSAADAEEVLQETNIVVWRKFEKFQPGSDFRAWVFQIAYYEIRKFHDRSRKAGLFLSDELIEQLSQGYRDHEDELEERRELLHKCLEKLVPNDRELVNSVFTQQVPVATLSQQTGREKTSIYRSLRRIRQLLFQCIERQQSIPDVS